MRSSFSLPAAAAFAALLWMSGCASGSSDSSTAQRSRYQRLQQHNDQQRREHAVNGDIDPGLQPYIDIAVGDLAERLSADAADITVTSATLVVWPDSSLGCPAPASNTRRSPLTARSSFCRQTAPSIRTTQAVPADHSSAKSQESHSPGQFPPICEILVPSDENFGLSPPASPTRLRPVGGLSLGGPLRTTKHAVDVRSPSADTRGTIS